MNSEPRGKLAAKSALEAGMHRRGFLATASAAAALAGSGSAALFAADEPKVSDGLAAKLRGAAMIVVGKIANRKDGPTGLSFPPLWNLTFQIAEGEKLRGKWADEAVAAFTVRQELQPAFDEKKKYVVALRSPAGGKGNWQATAIELADEGNLAIARKMASLPLGWEWKDDKILSPWRDRGEGYWPKEAFATAAAKCAVSGRPSFAAGDIIIETEQILPADRHEFKNPFGDGEFQITVTNPGDKPVVVPALLKDGDKILWEESLVIFTADNPMVLPGRAKISSQLKPTTLGPKEKVSGVIDTLTLPGIAWPRGGSRVYFTFALGEQAADNFFYYFSNLHDAIREKRAGKK